MACLALALLSLCSCPSLCLAAEIPDPDIFDGLLLKEGEGGDGSSEGSDSEGEAPAEPPTEGKDTGAAAGGVAEKKEVEKKEPPSGSGPESKEATSGVSVDLSVLKQSKKTATKTREFSKVPLSKNGLEIEVPEDFEKDTTIVGAREVISEQIEVERQEVLKQIEENPNKGSEQGEALPTDL